MTNLFGPGAFGCARPAAARPSFSPGNAPGDADDWAKDCTSPLARDGTEWRSAWLNFVIANLRNFVRGTVVTQDNTDDNLLLRAARAQSFSYRVAGGSANVLTVTLSPAPTGWSELVGAPLRVRIASTNTGGATFEVNTLGSKPLRTLAGAALAPGDLVAGAIMTFSYDQVSDTVLVTNLVKGVGPYTLGRISSITSTNAWNRPAGCRAILVEGLGAGGAGGGAGAAAANELSQGGGGGSGGYFRSFIVAPDSSYSATIGNGGASVAGGTGGNGGTTSWGSVASATGGTGGLVLLSGTGSNASACGAGGTGTGGDVNAAGSSGQRGARFTGATGYGGNGASSPYGGGGFGVGTDAAGGGAVGYGSGGGGALTVNGGSVRGGGQGAPGIINVWEFY